MRPPKLRSLSVASSNRRAGLASRTAPTVGTCSRKNVTRLGSQYTAGAASARNGVGTAAILVPDPVVATGRDSRSPSRAMRLFIVLREMPSTAAARVMFHAVAVSTRSRCSRVVAAPVGTGVAGAATGAGALRVGPGGRSRCAAVSVGVSASTTARSMTLLSSRTLPGHQYAVSAASASPVIVTGPSP
jgi:hypothetical protein